MARNSPSGWSARAIAASFERSVRDGRIGPSEVLPPVRELAIRLKVSPATVAAAYRLLRSRGLVAAAGRKGTRVVPRPAVRLRTPTGPASPEVIDLASGSPDPALLPSLAHAISAAHVDDMRREGAYLARLIEFVAGEFAADGLPAAPITLVSSGLDGIERALREHLRPGDHVAVEDPSFPALQDLLSACGLVMEPVAIDPSGVLPDSLAVALRRNCRACVVTARAQNPTGSVIDEARARELRQLLRKFPDVLLIETDPCGPVAGVPLVTLAETSRQRWVHIRSTSKFLGPDLRLAVLTGDALTIGRVEGRYAVGPGHVSGVLQQIALTLWSDPGAARQLARAAEMYRHRRDALHAALTERELEAQGTSGFNVWIRVPQETAIVQRLAEAGWAVAPGELFRLQSPPAIRVTVAALSPELAARFASDLAAALRVRTGRLS